MATFTAETASSSQYLCEKQLNPNDEEHLEQVIKLQNELTTDRIEPNRVNSITKSIQAVLEARRRF